MKLKKLFLILTALVAFSSTLTAVSDYEYLFGKYRTKKWLETHPEEKARREATARFLAEKKAKYIKTIDAYFIKIPNQNYSMMMTEITQKQWKTVMGNNPSKVKGDDLPVENVSWIDAVMFCNKLSEKEGLKPCYSYGRTSNVEEWDFLEEEIWRWSDSKWENFIDCDFDTSGYRLPTWAEWQYAARGGENYKYSGSDNLDEVGWYKGISEKKTHPVAQKKPNGYGLYDMSGNVAEWCWDSYPYYTRRRYYCGGGWRSNASKCKVGYEICYLADSTDDDLGFRIVRSSSKK